MNINHIRNDDDLARALTRVDQLWGAPIASEEGNELEALTQLIEKYEQVHFPTSSHANQALPPMSGR